MTNHGSEIRSFILDRIKTTRMPGHVAMRMTDDPAQLAESDWSYVLHRQADAIGQFGSYQATVEFDATNRYCIWSPEMQCILESAYQSMPTSMEHYLLSYVHPEDRARLQEIWRTVIVHAASATAEYRVITPDGTQKHVFDYMEGIRDKEKGSLLINGLLFDVAERKQIEGERLDATSRYHALVERLGGVPYIGSLCASGDHVHIGSGILALLGFDVDHWCTDPGLRMRQIYAEDHPVLQHALARHLETGNPLSIRYRMYGADGSLHWIHDEGRVVSRADGTPLFIQGVLFDVTKHKSARGELEQSHQALKALIAALESMRDEEQRRLAREMHDDLGQLLAAMKIDLSALGRVLPHNDNATASHLARINGLVDSMVCSVRRIIADLPPKDLEDFGLFPALEQMATRFENRFGLHCTLDLPQPDPTLSSKSAGAIYRFVQEAMNNVAKHAGATRVLIRVTTLPKALAIDVTDNGKGMRPGDQFKRGSFGLIGMRERIAALGGRLHIEPGEFGGTAITMEIPLTYSNGADSEH